MRESDFQSLFTKWIRLNRVQCAIDKTTVWELKIAKGSSLPFSRLEEHQEFALLEAKHGCVYHKISDQSVGRKPCDAIQICHSPAFVVVLYYVPHQTKLMYWVDIDAWVGERATGTRKSLTEARIKEIATYVFQI